MGKAHEALGDYVKAQELYEQGEHLFAQAGEVYSRNELRAQLADVALAQRDETKARALLEEANAYYNELGAPMAVGLAHHLLSPNRAAAWRWVPCPDST